MVPQIENPTHKLDIVNSKKKINIHDIFMGNKNKCDLCEYTASKSTVPKFNVNYVIQFAYPKLH